MPFTDAADLVEGFHLRAEDGVLQTGDPAFDAIGDPRLSGGACPTSTTSMRLCLDVDDAENHAPRLGRQGVPLQGDDRGRHRSG
jgi:hypothetical protein